MPSGLDLSGTKAGTRDKPVSNKAHPRFLRPTGCTEVNGGEEEIAEGMEVTSFVHNTLQKEDGGIQGWRGGERERDVCWLGLCVPAHPEHVLLVPGLSLCTPLLCSECLPQREPTCGVGGGAEEGF